MKKRIIAIILVMIMSISVLGCNKSNTDTNSVSSSSDKDSSKNSASGSKNDSSNNSDSSSKNNDGKSSNMDPSNNSSGNSSNNNSDTSDMVQEKPDTRIVVEGGEAEFEAAVDKLVAEKYPELKKLKDQGLIGIKAEPGKDTIKLGSWDLAASRSKTDGIKDALEWEVLKYSDDGKSALVVSKYLICCRKYNDEKTDITWENCTLRAWLNDEFYNGAFSLSEQSLIQKSKVVNEDYTDSWSKVYVMGGNDTEDYLFLLSLTEARTLFNVVEEMHGTCFSRICGYTDGLAGDWLLRTPGYQSDKVLRVCENSDVFAGGTVNEWIGVRPACWINLTPEIIKSNYLSIGGYQTLSESDLYVEMGDWDMRHHCRIHDSYKGMNENIEWLIIDYDKDNSRALLVSRYCLQLNHDWPWDKDDRYNDEDIDITWENCSLRSRLNSDFYSKAFSDSERKLIKKSLIINEDNDEYATAGGNDTEDYVFLLSLSEVDKYFKTENREDISRICSYKDGIVKEWWLRSPGMVGSHAAYVSDDGSVGAWGTSGSRYSENSVPGVRPALWLNLDP